jgi:CRP-like cAMP-binding protein
MLKLVYLKNIPLFSGFSKQGLEKMARLGKTEVFNAGETIFSEYSGGDKLYIVISGRVKIFTEAGQKKKTLAHIEKSEFFGEMALIDKQPRSASSVAMEHSELFTIKKKDFQQLLAKYPSIYLQVLKTLSMRLRQADKEIEALTFGDVLGRVAATLLQLSSRYGQTTKGGCTLQMPVNQSDIAEIAGTGREMVSRILNRFRRLKVIEYNEKYLKVIDAQKLVLFSKTAGKKE